MNLVYLSEVFTIINGVPSGNVTFVENNFIDKIEYKRPSLTYQSTFSGFINREEINKNKIFPPETLFVSTNGQGSHSYSYVSHNEFVPNSDVSVLIPKVELSLAEKIYYANVITKNRYKFSYGRKPKGSRLANIKIPDPKSLPIWVKNINTFNFKNVEKPVNDNKIDLSDRNWEYFNYENVFNIKRGSENKKSNEIGFIPFISATEKNNGILGYVNCELPEKENQLTVATVGSVCEAFWQENRFIASSNMLILNNKNLTKYSAMFIITLIRKEKYRYSYGRVWSMEKMRKSQIKLPVNNNGEPDWQFMEDYIKSLPFSSGL